MLISSDVFYLGSDRLQQSDVKLLLYCTAVYKFPDLLQFYFIEKKMYWIFLKRGLNNVLKTKKRKNERLVYCGIFWLDFFSSKMQLNWNKYKNMEL